MRTNIYAVLFAQFVFMRIVQFCWTVFYLSSVQ